MTWSRAEVGSVSANVRSVLSFGHRQSIADLYRRHGASVVRRARRITGSDDEAQEVLQELFQSLIEKPQSLRGVRDEVAWLYGATTHLCLNRIRNRKNRERLLREHGVGPEHYDSTAEQAALVKQALGTLPEELAATVVYYYLDQMTHAEIAKILGCSRRQIGKLLEQAHGRLQRLDKEAPDE